MASSGLAKIGLALCYLISIETAILAFPKHKGLINSVLLFVYAMAATVLDVVVSIYINPKDEAADKCVNLGPIEEW
jgi:hypothetical protein